MTTFIILVQFIGAWLVFAGSIYQAFLQLQDEDLEIDRIRATGAKVQKPPRPSSKWLIVTPIWVYKEYHRNHLHRKKIMDALSQEDIDSMISFRSKAFAWQIVATGGLCIAIGETYELSHRETWGVLILLVIIVVMIVLSIVNVVYNIRRFKVLQDNQDGA